MAHVPPRENTLFRGSRMYRIIDAKTKNGIYKRCAFTLLWTSIALTWTIINFRHNNAGLFQTMPNAAVFILFAGMTWLRALTGLIIPQGYFNLFIAPRVLKNMSLLHKLKVVYSRAVVTAIVLFFAYFVANSQGHGNNFFLYWAIFSGVAYLSIFVPVVNEFVYELCMTGYTGMLEDWGDVKAASHSDPLPIRKYIRERRYSAKYSGFAGNYWD